MLAAVTLASIRGAGKGFVSRARCRRAIRGVSPPAAKGVEEGWKAVLASYRGGIKVTLIAELPRRRLVRDGFKIPADPSRRRR